MGYWDVPRSDLLDRIAELEGILASAQDLANVFAREHNVAEGRNYDTSYDVKYTFERVIFAVIRKWQKAERELAEARGRMREAIRYLREGHDPSEARVVLEAALNEGGE